MLREGVCVVVQECVLSVETGGFSWARLALKSMFCVCMALGLQPLAMAGSSCLHALPVSLACVFVSPELLCPG